MTTVTDGKFVRVIDSSEELCSLHEQTSKPVLYMCSEFGKVFASIRGSVAPVAMEFVPDEVRAMLELVHAA